MNQKQWIGVVLIAIGVIALIFSQVIIQRVGGETGKVRDFTGALSQTGSAGKSIGGALENYAEGEGSGYLQTAQMLRVGGIILIVVGGSVLFFYRKRKR